MDIDVKLSERLRTEGLCGSLRDPDNEMKNRLTNQSGQISGGMIDSNIVTSWR